MNKKNQIEIKKIINKLIIPLVLFVVLLILVIFKKTTGIDNFVYDLISKLHNKNFTSVVKFITEIGDAIIIISICLLLFIIPKTRYKYGIYAFFSVGGAAVVNQILKRIVRRDRPTVTRLIAETGFSFPSGHAMVSSALFITIILLILKNNQKRTSPIKIKRHETNKLNIKNKVIITSLIILTVLIGLTRVYLGVHFITDILAGWILGFVASIIVVDGLDLIIENINKKEN